MIDYSYIRDSMIKEYLHKKDLSYTEQINKFKIMLAKIKDDKLRVCSKMSMNLNEYVIR